MKWLIEWFKKAKNMDLTAEEIAELEKLGPKPPVTPPTPSTTPSGIDPAIMSQLNAQNEEIKNLTILLTKEKEAREAAIKTMEEKQKTERAKEIADVIDKALKVDMKIEPKNEEKIKMYTDLLEKDFELGKKMIDGLPKLGGTPAQDTNNKGGAGNGAGTVETKDRGMLFEAAKSAFAETK
jgi:hypothetical protein